MQALLLSVQQKKQPLPKHLKNLNSVAHDNKIFNLQNSDLINFDSFSNS